MTPFIGLKPRTTVPANKNLSNYTGDINVMCYSWHKHEDWSLECRSDPSLVERPLLPTIWNVYCINETWYDSKHIPLWRGDFGADNSNSWAKARTGLKGWRNNSCSPEAMYCNIRCHLWLHVRVLLWFSLFLPHLHRLFVEHHHTHLHPQSVNTWHHLTSVCVYGQSTLS